MRRIFVVALSMLAASQLYAQELKTHVEQDSVKTEAWKLSGAFGVNLTQTSLTNWSAGGENAFAGNALLNLKLDHTSGNWLWQNNLVMEYGLTNTDSNGTQKSSDRLEVSTQLGYTTDHKWYYSGMVDFKTQFAKGYNNADKDFYISKFMAPAYANASLGIEYKPEDKFYSVYYSPAAAKFTIVTDDYLSDQGSFGLDPGDKFRAEFGTYLKAKAEKEIMENVKILTDVNFFTAYNKSFGDVDVEWNTLINMKINKFLNASITTSLKYDNDVKYIDEDGEKRGPRVQFKEILGVGFGYTF